MTNRAELIQDLLAHAHEAPSMCAALMCRAASELRRHDQLAAIERMPPRLGGRAQCQGADQ